MLRDCLDAFLAVGADHPHSPLHQIKISSSNPSVGGMKRLPGEAAIVPADEPEAASDTAPSQGWRASNLPAIRPQQPHVVNSV